MTHVHVLYAGGTIGMQASAQGLRPGTDLGKRLTAIGGSALAALGREEGVDWTVEAIEPPIDSAEAAPLTWALLEAKVRTAAQQADAVVVLHGTDTLAFSASALSFRLLGLGKPVVLTGSQRPLEAPGSDALDNVLLGLRAAAAGRLREVAVAFGGQVLRANRCIKRSAQDARAFESPNCPVLASVGGEGQPVWNDQALALLPRPDALEPPVDGHPREPSISVIRVHPGLDVDRWRAWSAAGRLDALVIQAYGSGNAPLTSTPLLAWFSTLHSTGTLLVATTQCAHGAVDLSTYASGSPLREVGMVGLADMTTECAITKLDWVLRRGMPVARSEAWMQRDFCGEITVADREAA
jgi:L-asparaginase